MHASDEGAVDLLNFRGNGNDGTVEAFKVIAKERCLASCMSRAASLPKVPLKSLPRQRDGGGMQVKQVAEVVDVSTLCCPHHGHVVLNDQLAP